MCLQIHAAVAKGELGFPAYERELALERAGVLHNPDALAAAALGGLD